MRLPRLTAMVILLTACCTVTPALAQDQGDSAATNQNAAVSTGQKASQSGAADFVATTADVSSASTQTAAPTNRRDASSKRKESKQSGTADAVATAAEVVHANTEGIEAAATTAAKYSGDVQSAATASKYLGAMGAGLNGIGEAAPIYSAGKKGGEAGAVREGAQIATENSVKTALEWGAGAVAKTAAEGCDGPVTATAALAFQCGLAIRDHTKLGHAVQNTEFDGYQKVRQWLGEDHPQYKLIPPPKTAPSPDSTQRLLLQSLKGVRFTSQTGENSADSVGQRSSDSTQRLLVQSLKGVGFTNRPVPIDDVDSVGQRSSDSTQRLLVQSLKGVRFTPRTSSESVATQVSNLKTDLRAWDQQQAELKRQQEEAAREAAQREAEERQEQAEQQARDNQEISDDSDDQGESDADSNESLQHLVARKLWEAEAQKRAPYIAARQAVYNMERQREAYEAAREAMQSAARYASSPLPYAVPPLTMPVPGISVGGGVDSEAATGSSYVENCGGTTVASEVDQYGNPLPCVSQDSAEWSKITAKDAAVLSGETSGTNSSGSAASSVSTTIQDLENSVDAGLKAIGTTSTSSSSAK